MVSREREKEANQNFWNNEQIFRNKFLSAVYFIIQMGVEMEKKMKMKKILSFASSSLLLSLLYANVEQSK